MKKIFLLYGHYNEKSFNAAIRDTFIKSAEEGLESKDESVKVNCLQTVNLLLKVPVKKYFLFPRIISVFMLIECMDCLSLQSSIFFSIISI